MGINSFLLCGLPMQSISFLAFPFGQRIPTYIITYSYGPDLSLKYTILAKVNWSHSSSNCSFTKKIHRDPEATWILYNI